MEKHFNIKQKSVQIEARSKSDWKGAQSTMNNTQEQEMLLNRVQENAGRLSELLNRRYIRRFLRIYGVLTELWRSSPMERLQLLKRVFLRLSKKPVTIHAKAEYNVWFQISACLENISIYAQKLHHDVSAPFQPTLVNSDADLAVYDLICQVKREGKRIICIMAPMFSHPIVDGYFRRIKTIDDLMGEHTLKLYMSPTYNPTQGQQLSQVIDSCHIKISYRSDSQEDRFYIRKIADVADIVYHHGVGYMDEEIIRKKHLLKIVDLHGILPEEFAMSGNYRMVQRESLHEELAMRYANYIICVTEAMQEHMERKYPQYKQNYIILPILDDSVYQNYDKPWPVAEQGNRRPTIVYAGGMQEWQMIPEMQKCMRVQPDLEYRIYTAERDKFWEIWKKDGENVELDHLYVTSVSAQELWSEYEKCQYGFALRKDIAVNHVACPTKLIEYITKGIVPIVNTEHLGDFQKKGLRFLSIDDFCRGKFPDEETRKMIATHNRKIVREIMTQHSTGKKALNCILEGSQLE